MEKAWAVLGPRPFSPARESPVHPWLREDEALRPTPRGAGGAMSPRRIIGEPDWRSQGVASTRRFLRDPRRDEPRAGVHPNRAGNKGAFHALRVPAPGGANYDLRPRQFHRASRLPALVSAYPSPEKPWRAWRTLKRSCVRLAPASMREVEGSSYNWAGFDPRQGTTTRHLTRNRSRSGRDQSHSRTHAPWATRISPPRCILHNTHYAHPAN
jgi:hypothetical protein